MSSSDDLQTIPARHGTATFVPKGSTIKIVNTSGTQVIDTWAFALPTPPKKKGPQEEPQNDKDKSYQEQDEKEKLKLAEEEEKKKQEEEKKKQEEEENKKKEQEEKDKASKKKSNRKSRGSLDLPSQEEAEAATSQQQQLADAESKQQSTPTKSGWTSYLPSLRGRKQITDGNAKDDKKDEDTSTEQTDKKQDKENSRRWASYLLNGQGVTSYLPKGAISAFAAQSLTHVDEQHARDPSKSYAEQLADFSRTPVGAASLSALTGSGSVSSLYAGYSAWNAMHGETAQMEYLSMPHTRASTLHMVPRVNDVLVSNLREPMLTLIEDTSSGVHDTLIPACDPQRYKALQIEDWEQHGSCAENLVLALKELNDRAGLKGPKGVGASVTVNSVPAPLNLFMNIPWKGDKGDLSFEPPTCKEGDYVRFRAERDVVVVMSACPNDVQQINKGQSKDGHFLVENADDSEDEEAPAEVKKAEPKAEKKKPRKLGKKDEVKPEEKAKSEKSEEQKAEKAPLPNTPAVEKSESASSPAPKSKGQPKNDKPEEQKKAEKVPLPETPATEKSEAASLPAPPKQVKGKPKKLADEAQKKAENTPLPETPATGKPESAASPAPASSSSGQAAPKPKGKPKKLIDSTTGEKKKPRKLESRAKGTATPKSGSAASQQGDATAGAEKNGS
ncbi:hypothetical protein KCV05_g16293, partial [Aureobasidium melanogenum]